MRNFLKNTLDIDIDYRDVAKNIFCIAIASKPHVQKDINKVFNKNKLEYMRYFKNSNIYKDPLNKTLMPEISLYSEKVLGILEKCIDTNDFNEIFDLYKKSHRKLYNGIKSKKNISINDIGKYLSIGIEGNYELVATMYIFNLLGSPIKDTNALIFLNNILNDLLQLSYYDQTNYSKAQFDRNAEKIKELREFMGLEKRSYTGEELITAILKKDKTRYNNKKILVPWEMISEDDYHTIEKIGEVGKYIGSCEGLFKYLRINSADLMKKTSFTPSDINSIIMSYIYSTMFNNFTEEDRNIFLVCVIYFTALSKAYGNLKDIYLKTVNEDFLEEINELQVNLEKSIYNAKKSEESFNKKEAILLDREKELLQKIKELEKENKRLVKEVDESKSLKQEVIKLRNTVFEGTNSECEDNLNSENDELSLDELNNDKVIIFGGSTTWVNNMKEKLPNAKFAGVEYRNTKLDFIKKDSKVFINTDMSHAFYYKIKDVLSKVNSDYFYINGSSNIESSLVHMKKSLNNK